MTSLMKTDPTAWKKLRQQIIERDGNHCLKCGRTSALQVHHIIPIREDGSDKPENLTTLCEVCHREWEVFESGLETPFAEWLKLPPFALLVSMYKVMGYEQHASRTASQIRRDIDQAHKSMLMGLGSPYMATR